MVMLKHELQKRDLPTKGIKRTLVARLREAAEAEKPKSADIKPGTAGIDAVATREVESLGFASIPETDRSQAKPLSLRKWLSCKDVARMLQGCLICDAFLTAGG